VSPPPLAEQIRERAAAASIPVLPEQVERLQRYYQLLERWNRTINLTALPLAGDPATTIDRLIMEPLLAATYIAGAPALWVDLGSGGGSPAIPLKVVMPGVRLIMVESRERKAAFLRQAVTELGLADCEVLTARFEDLEDGELCGRADLITVRAVKANKRLASSAAALLRASGRLVLFHSASPFVFNDFRFVIERDVRLGHLKAGLAIFAKRNEVPRGTLGP
jgi:16S rRNA (guanine527-N7)-methyltransferase